MPTVEHPNLHICTSRLLAAKVLHLIRYIMHMHARYVLAKVKSRQHNLKKWSTQTHRRHLLFYFNAFYAFFFPLRHVLLCSTVPPSLISFAHVPLRPANCFYTHQPL